MYSRRSLRDEQVGNRRLRDAVGVRLAQPRAEPAADHDRLEIEQVDRRADAGAKRGDRPADQRDRQLVVLF